MAEAWDHKTVECKHCKACMTTPLPYMGPLDVDGEVVLWCPSCGTLMVGGVYQPLADAQWRFSSLALYGGPEPKKT